MAGGGKPVSQLEADALRQYNSLPASYHDAYRQIILFPIEMMSNLHQMYFAQAQNHASTSRAIRRRMYGLMNASASSSAIHSSATITTIRWLAASGTE